MSQENRKKLVDALRSGKYKQCHGSLGIQRPDGTCENCALGVACEVAIENGVCVHKFIRPRLRDEDNKSIDIAYDNNRGILPISVQDWLGFADAEGSLTAQCICEFDLSETTIANLNDSTYTFHDIANIIEKGGVQCA